MRFTGRSMTTKHVCGQSSLEKRARVYACRACCCRTVARGNLSQTPSAHASYIVRASDLTVYHPCINKCHIVFQAQVEGTSAMQRSPRHTLVEENEVSTRKFACPQSRIRLGATSGTAYFLHHTTPPRSHMPAAARPRATCHAPSLARVPTSTPDAPTQPSSVLSKHVPAHPAQPSSAERLGCANTSSQPS